MIEITEDKQYELAEHAGKVLKHAGKLMQCIEDMCDESESQMGMRGGGQMGQRFGGRYSGVAGQMEGMRGRMGRRMIDPYYE